MFSNLNKSVLIVGAGPTGLTTAAFLARQGITFDLIDSRHDAVTDSRALGIHARTLEFMAMLGLDKQFLEKGHRTRYMTFHRGSRRLFRLDFNKIRDLTDYPFMLVLPQSDSERILIRHLNNIKQPILWGYKLKNFTQKSAFVETSIILPSGEVESRQYSYLIGCDGAGSTVRNLLNISFDGVTYDARFLLSEVEIANNAIDRSSSHVYMGEKTTVAVIPQPHNLYRIVGPDFSCDNEGAEIINRKEVTFDSFSEFLNENKLLQHIEILNPSRIVSYRVHKRVAKQFRDDKVFIAGDAAHIHSPAGGQGMNTGLHDAVNLTWRIARVLHGMDDEKLLDGYDAERRTAATVIVNGADAAMMKVVSRRFIDKFFFDYMAPLVTYFLQPKKLIAAISQVSWCYPSDDQGKYKLGRYFCIGKRVPNLMLEDGHNLFEYFGTEDEVVIISSNKPGITLPYWCDLFEDCKVLVLAKPISGRLPFTHFEGVLLCRPDGFLSSIYPLPLPKNSFFSKSKSAINQVVRN